MHKLAVDTYCTYLHAMSCDSSLDLNSSWDNAVVEDKDRDNSRDRDSIELDLKLRQWAVEVGARDKAAKVVEFRHLLAVLEEVVVVDTKDRDRHRHRGVVVLLQMHLVSARQCQRLYWH